MKVTDEAFGEIEEEKREAEDRNRQLEEKVREWRREWRSLGGARHYTGTFSLPSLPPSSQVASLEASVASTAQQLSTQQEKISSLKEMLERADEAIRVQLLEKDGLADQRAQLEGEMQVGGTCHVCTVWVRVFTPFEQFAAVLHSSVANYPPLYLVHGPTSEPEFIPA